MPRSGCSALHGVNPNLKESSRHKYFILSQKSEKRIPGKNKRLNLRSLFVDLGNQFLIPLIEGLFIWRWAALFRWASLPRWDDFYPTFILTLLWQFNQRVCYVTGKRLFDQVVFLNCLINIWKTKQSWLKKTLSCLAELAHLCVFIWKIFILLRWDLGKIKWDLT